MNRKPEKQATAKIPTFKKFDTRAAFFTFIYFLFDMIAGIYQTHALCALQISCAALSVLPT